MVGRKYENGGIAKRRRQDGDGGLHRAGSEIHHADRRLVSAPAITACAAAPMRRASCGAGPTAAFRVMGGEQAASVLAQRAARRAGGARRKIFRRGGGGVQGADTRAIRDAGPSLLRDRAAVGRRRHRSRRQPPRARPLAFAPASTPRSAKRASACSGCEPMFETLEILRAGEVATVWLNRPERHNAFDAPMVAELTRAFATLGADAACARWCSPVAATAFAPAPISRG